MKDLSICFLEKTVRDIILGVGEEKERVIVSVERRREDGLGEEDGVGW